jgi:hypothetical protein
LTTKKPSRTIYSLTLFLILDILNYHVQLSSSKLKPNGQQRVILCLIDDVGNQIECVNSGTSFSPVENVKLWWPREMGDQPLYTLEVSFADLMIECFIIFRYLCILTPNWWTSIVKRLDLDGSR